MQATITNKEKARARKAFKKAKAIARNQKADRKQFARMANPSQEGLWRHIEETGELFGIRAPRRKKTA